MPGRDRRRVFVSYSRADAAWLKRLQVHVRPLVRDAEIEWWDDTMIQAGDDWRREIEAALASAKVAVLLVSAYFLASDFIVTEELPRLLWAAEDEGTTILPLIISPCRFAQTATLARFQAINSPAKPLSKLRRWEQDEILAATADAVERALRVEAPEGRVATYTDPPAASALPGSSARTTVPNESDSSRTRDSADDGRVFIADRRGNAATVAERMTTVVGRLYDRLALSFGLDSVKSDLTSLPQGSDRRKAVVSAQHGTSVVLVIIGRDWDASLLADPLDPLRQQLTAALGLPGVIVMPVLIDDASLPPEHELPAPLEAIVRQRAITIRSDSPDFEYDADHLALAVAAWIGRAPVGLGRSDRPPWIPGIDPWPGV